MSLKKVWDQIPPVVDAAVLQFHERWHLPIDFDLVEHQSLRYFSFIQFSSMPEFETFNPMIKSSRQSFQFQMMKSLTSLPPSSASAARPSPWSYSPKQILFFLKFDCESLEGIKASSPSSSGPPAPLVPHQQQQKQQQVHLVNNNNNNKFTRFFWPSCCLLCLIRSRRRSVSSCEFAKLLIVVSGIGRFTCTWPSKWGWDWFAWTTRTSWCRAWRQRKNPEWLRER